MDAGRDPFFNENYPQVEVQILMETMMKSETGLFMDKWTADFVIYCCG